ncbi:uncharacterized protein RHOBADRAFT_52098, partial [Rhodotorula graminis WP1]
GVPRRLRTHPGRHAPLSHPDAAPGQARQRHAQLVHRLDRDHRRPGRLAALDHDQVARARQGGPERRLGLLELLGVHQEAGHCRTADRREAVRVGARRPVAPHLAGPRQPRPPRRADARRAPAPVRGASDGPGHRHRRRRHARHHRRRAAGGRRQGQGRRPVGRRRRRGFRRGHGERRAAANACSRRVGLLCVARHEPERPRALAQPVDPPDGRVAQPAPDPVAAHAPRPRRGPEGRRGLPPQGRALVPGLFPRGQQARERRPQGRPARRLIGARWRRRRRPLGLGPHEHGQVGRGERHEPPRAHPVQAPHRHGAPPRRPGGVGRLARLVRRVRRCARCARRRGVAGAGRARARDGRRGAPGDARRARARAARRRDVLGAVLLAQGDDRGRGGAQEEGAPDRRPERGRLFVGHGRRGRHLGRCVAPPVRRRRYDGRPLGLARRRRLVRPGPLFRLCCRTSSLRQRHAHARLGRLARRLERRRRRRRRRANRTDGRGPERVVAAPVADAVALDDGRAQPAREQRRRGELRRRRRQERQPERRRARWRQGRRGGQGAQGLGGGSGRGRGQRLGVREEGRWNGVAVADPA